MGILDLFSGKQHLTIKHKKYTFEIYDSPGQWMDRERLKELQGRMISIAVSRLGMKPSFSFFVDADSLKNKLVTICTDGTTDYAFNALTHIGKYKNKKIIHMGAAYSKKEDKGIMQLLYFWMCTYIVLRNRLRPLYVTSLTHVPKIFGAMAESFSNVFPSGVPDESPKQFHLDIKDILMDTYLKEWDLPATPIVCDNFSIKGFRIQNDGTVLYPDTIETVPKHRNPKYNRYCMENISYANGDEILQVGTLKPFAFLNSTNWKVFRKGN